jgi:pyruvate dehydrogenase E2 component (dihydrolipoamide acetyltransferase)
MGSTLDVPPLGRYEYVNPLDPSRRGSHSVATSSMNAIINVTVPDIGDFKEIPVIEILVKPGDHVDPGTSLVILESDKATLDVPSPESGTVKELSIHVGDRVSIGSALLTLDASATASAPVTELTVTDLRVVTEVPSSITPVQAIASVPPSLETDIAPGGARAPLASPSMRRFAREFGIDLRGVTGTGPRGRIVREDLQRIVKSAFTTPVAPANTDPGGGLRLPAWPKIDHAKYGPIARAPLSKIRKIAGANLARNWAVIPHVTNFEDADITDLDAFRQQLNPEGKDADIKVTMLAFLIRAVGATLKKYPEFSSSLDGDELILKHYCHIGFAVDTPDGLVVPVIRDVESKGIRHIATEAASLAVQARRGKLTPADMQGGCFTISSLGGIGGTGFTPIINAPEVAILGVTRAQIRPRWSGKEFQPRLILSLSLSWDHRVLDGAAAARFLAHISTLLADFRRILI